MTNEDACKLRDRLVALIKAARTLDAVDVMQGRLTAALEGAKFCRREKVDEYLSNIQKLECVALLVFGNDAKKYFEVCYRGHQTISGEVH